jgi:hypothetical protein
MSQRFKQTRVQIGMTSPAIRVSEVARVSRVLIQESLKDCFEHQRLNVLWFRLVPWVNGVKKRG